MAVLIPARKEPIAIWLMLIMAGLLTGCKQKNDFVAPPPPMVTVSQPVRQAVTSYAEFTGTTEAVESVEVRARVEGFLETVNFQEGALVEEGSLLYVIDPKPFQARLDQAEAELATREAELVLAEFDYKRVERLRMQEAAPEFELVKAASAQQAAQAAVQAARAAVDTARLNLGYTQITAPISGRVSRTRVDAGNLVGAGEFTLLTTILKDDPIFVYFSVSERELLEDRKANPEKYTATGQRDRWPLQLGLSNESGYPHQGHFDWADNRVDTDTGTIQIRGIFPNPDHTLLPGLFVRIRSPVDTQNDALLITDRAIGADQGGRYLLVINDQNIVEKHYVEVAAVVDGMRVIREGLAADEWVITQGVQRVREGMPVTPLRPGQTPALPPMAQAESSATQQSE